MTDAPLELLRPNSKDPHLRGMTIRAQGAQSIHTAEAPYFIGSFAQVDGKERGHILLMG